MSTWIALVLATSFLSIRQPEAPPTSPAPSAVPAPSTPADPAAAVQHEAALSAEDRDEVLDAIGKTLERRAFVPGVDFAGWSTRLEGQRSRIDQTDDPAEFAAAVNRGLAGFGISHLRLKPPSRTPAPSDPGAAESDAAEEIETAFQPGAGPRRGPTENQSLTWNGEVAVLRIRSFDDELYSREKIEALVEELRPRATGLVLDLRNNGGGAVTNLSHLLGLFLKEGTAIGVYVNREVYRAFERSRGKGEAGGVGTVEEAAAWTDRKYRIRRNSKPLLTLPVAVLLSRGSASASEIVAAALRDHANAAILGQPSAGKVLLSVHAKLPKGFELQIPTADYVTNRGQRLEGHPIKPHITVPGGRGSSNGAATQAAADLLRNGL